MPIACTANAPLNCVRNMHELNYTETTDSLTFRRRRWCRKKTTHKLLELEMHSSRCMQWASRTMQTKWNNLWCACPFKLKHSHGHKRRYSIALFCLFCLSVLLLLLFFQLLLLHSTVFYRCLFITCLWSSWHIHYAPDSCIHLRSYAANMPIEKVSTPKKKRAKQQQTPTPFTFFPRRKRLRKKVFGTKHWDKSIWQVHF